MVFWSQRFSGIYRRLASMIEMISHSSVTEIKMVYLVKSPHACYVSCFIRSSICVFLRFQKRFQPQIARSQSQYPEGIRLARGFSSRHVRPSFLQIKLTIYLDEVPLAKYSSVAG